MGDSIDFDVVSTQKIKVRMTILVFFIFLTLLLMNGGIQAKSIESVSNTLPLNNSTRDNTTSYNEINKNPSEIDMNENENENENEFENNKINDDRSEREEYAKRMITYMDQNIDPCDDFYEYACGNWKNTLRERQSPHKRNNLLDIGYKLADMVQDLLENSAESLKSEYSIEIEQAQTFYRSCLKAELRPLPKSDTYLEIIKSIGGFPAIDSDWNADDFSWFNMSAHLTNFGGGGFIYEEIVSQYPFPPYFKLPELGFDLIVHSDNISSNKSRGYQLNSDRMREYLTTYGVSEPKISEIIASVFELWHAILEVQDEFEEDFDKCNDMGTAEDIVEWATWDTYLEIAWNGKSFPEGFTVCPCPYFYTKLESIFKERKEATANYLALKFLYRMDARLENVKFQREFCNIKVKTALSFLIDKLYIAKYFRFDKRAEVTALIGEVRKSLREILQKVDWLDEETRNEALLKESLIQARIGSFENDEMMNRLIHEMRNLTFSESNYERNNIEITKFRQYIKRFIGMHYEELSNNTKPLELMIGMQVNAFYYNIDNSINVMAGILHPPAYHSSWPYSLKFGTLGYLIGHEFTHGFDTVGAYYDGNGKDRFWWTKKSAKIFSERAKCYADMFDSYLVPEINRNINGNQTKDENIADNGGLREALISYRRFMQTLSKNDGKSPTSLSKDERMPGLDLNPEQLFFLGFAQLWCADYKEEHYWEELTNEHTMDKFRVLGTVSNMEDFAKAYNCTVGSKMYPKENRCELW